jgi:hypothetical protein
VRGRSTVQLDLPDARRLIDAVRAARIAGVKPFEPPHLSLAWPWLHRDAALAAAGELREIAVSSSPLPLTFDQLGIYESRHQGRSVLILRTRPSGELLGLAARVRTLAGQGIEEFDPHLSVARSEAPESLTLLHPIVACHLPLAVRATTLELRVQEGSGWRVVVAVTLGRR